MCAAMARIPAPLPRPAPAAPPRARAAGPGIPPHPPAMLQFILLVNKQGQTRLARYADASLTPAARHALEGEVVRKCLARSDKLVREERWSGRGRGGTRDGAPRPPSPPPPPFTVLLRRARRRPRRVPPLRVPLLPGGRRRRRGEGRTKPDPRPTPARAPTPRPRPRPHPSQNELAILEFIHALVEALDRHFGNVCELDIMYNLETAHYALDEMVANGSVVDGCRANVLAPLQLLDAASTG